jgi:aspartyl-tRNA(Asn)/glutamyl-tRNA(Gln) amidotransferase subunit B
VEELRKTLPENPSLRKNRLQAEWGITDHDMASVINAGALDLVLATIDAGVDQNGARKWWLGELARLAKEMSIELIDLPITAQHLSQVEKLIADGKLNDKLARVVIEAVINGEGDIDSIIEKRGLAVVSDDSSLLNALDEALAASPDIAAKIKEGKLQAAGAIVGAVMKTTKGQADAAKVRALLFDKLGVTEDSE